MDNDTKRVIDHTAGAGTADQAEGNVREGVGKGKQAVGAVTGNDSLRAEGVKDEVAGKAQNALGEVKEGAEKLLDKAKSALRE